MFLKKFLKSKICPGIRKSSLENRTSILKMFKLKIPILSTQIPGFLYTIVQCYVYRPLTDFKYSICSNIIFCPCYIFSNLLRILINFESYLEIQYLHHDTFLNYYSHASLGNILRRVRPVWSHKTSLRFWKVFRFRPGFLGT